MNKKVKEIVKKILPPKDKSIPNSMWARGKKFGRNEYRKEVLGKLKTTKRK